MRWVDLDIIDRGYSLMLDRRESGVFVVGNDVLVCGVLSGSALKVLCLLRTANFLNPSQHLFCRVLGMSIGTVNKSVQELLEYNIIDRNYRVLGSDCWVGVFAENSERLLFLDSR